MCSYEKLRNCIHEVVDEYLSVMQKPEHLTTHPNGDLYAIIKQTVERELHHYVVKRCDDNQSRAAHLLGISRLTLRKRLQEGTALSNK